MPLTRYQSRNEYGLADPDLYQAADKDDPEALLEGVAMAGLVGILRQLGDLAEFAAEMFHDLHEEVMATASRSHGLMARVQQLEAEFPFVEKALLCQTDHTPFFSAKGVEWHPNLQLEQSVVTRGDLPRCVMDSYEECRGPPRLFLLDKFDISGAGACLKRYTDPSFVRHEKSSYESSWDDIQREKKSQKAKRRASHWRNGGTPENALTSHAKLHELFLEEHLEARHPDPARVVKLKTRKLDGYSLISKSGESYMEKFVQTSVDNKTGYQIITPNPELSAWNMNSARDVVTDKPEISMVGALEKSHRGRRAEVSLSNEREKVSFIEKDIETVPESTYSSVPGTTITKGSQTNSNEKAEFLQHRSYSEDLTSEADNYVDAPATMESETETEDECRPKNRSGALTDENVHTYSDADEERMKLPPQFSFFHSTGNTPASENGRSSVGKRSTSFSYSDSASISVDGQSDGEKISECLPSASSFKSELGNSTSHATPEASKSSHKFNVQESVSSSSADRQRSFSSSDTCSSPRPDSQNAESRSLTVQSLAPEVVETSPELVGLDLIKEADDVSKVNPVCSSRSGASFDGKNSKFPSESSSISSTSEGSRRDTAVEKNCMVDLVNSGTSPQGFVDSQTGEQSPVADNDSETNSANASYKALANSGSDSRSCDDSSLTGNVLPCSAGMGMEVSRDITDMHYSKVCGPGMVDEIELKDNQDDETKCITVTNADDTDSQNSGADVDSQSSEIPNEHSCAFGTSADASVSEFHENSLENGVSVPAEADSKLTYFKTEREKLVGDASPTSSKCDGHISDSQSHLSYVHDEGFHDLPGQDDAVAGIVPKVELAVSDNHAGTFSGDDVNHAVSLSSTTSTGSLPWISTNTYQSASEAEKICHDTVAVSNKTLPVEDKPESEKRMQESPLEVSSKGLGTSLDNDDLASCESLRPMASLEQSDRDTEPKSPCKSILVDNCIDSSPVNNPNLLESVTIEQSVKVQTPYPNQTFADEELLQPSVSGGLESVPQTEGIELNSPEQELKVNPNFPSFGLIPETISPNQEDMPPLPPLPPMQWRIGKVSHSFFPTFMGESVETRSSAPSVETSSCALSAEPANVQFGSKPSELPVSQGSDKSEQLDGEFVNNASEKPLQSSIQFPTIGTDLNTQYDTSGSQITQSVYLSAELPTMPQGSIEDFNSEENNLLANHAAQNHERIDPQELSLQLPQDPYAKLPTMPNQGEIEDFGPEENNLLADHAAQNHELVYSGESSVQLSHDPSAKLPTMPNQGEIEDSESEENNLLVDHAPQNHELVYTGESSVQLSQDPSVKYKDFEDDTDVNVSQSSKGSETEAVIPTQSTEVEDNGHPVPDASNAETAEPSTSSAQKIIPVSLGDAMWPARSFSVAPTLEINKLEEVPMVKLPRPRSPLVDAVAAHDRRTMKKVSERVQPPIKSKQDDKDSLLAQIRSKSVSLKPAVSTRPSIQTGPKTNLRVAAILEKANTIRQAMAGSDEDEDSDSWSDS